MVRSKITGEFLGDESGTPPSGQGRGRRGSRRGRGRGRGSAPTSPVLSPDEVEVDEEEVQLRDIPGDVGPAVGGPRVRPSRGDIEPPRGAVGGDSSSEEDNLGMKELKCDMLADEIERERLEYERLKNEKTLADLRRKNQVLRSELKSGKKARQGSDIAVSQFPGSRRRTEPPRLDQAIGGAEAFPTIHQFCEEEEGDIPDLATLRGRRDLQDSADRIVDGIWNPPEQAGTTAKLESGRSARSESGILKPIIWPHTRLGGRLAQPNFDKLDLQNLLIGELSIIESSDISEVERKARSKQAKRVLVYSRKYDWNQIREFHGSFLASVERAGTWEIDANEIASEFLFVARVNQPAPPVHVPFPQPQPQVYQYPPGVVPGAPQQPPPYQQPQGGPRRGGNRQFFCSVFNRSQCPHVATHKAVVGGRVRWVDHICAYCWLNLQEANEHSEQDCPHPGARKNKQQGA